jgi:hypothetical protein
MDRSRRLRAALPGLLVAALFAITPLGQVDGQGVPGLGSPTPGRGGTPYAVVPTAPHAPVKTSEFSEAWRAPLSSPLLAPLLGAPGLLVATLDSGALVAVSPQDGHVVWKQDSGNRPAGGAVLSRSNIVLAGQDGQVAGFSLQGAPLWKADLGEPIPHPPTGTADSVLIPLASAKLVALRGDGVEQWRASLSSPASVPPSACRGLVVVGTQSGTVEAFLRDTGERLWIAKTASEVVSPILCYRGGMYFGTADSRMWALRYSGRKMWKYPAGARCEARPFGFQERIYFPSFDNYVYALNARSGNLILRVRLSHRLAHDFLMGEDRVYESPYTSGKLTSLSLPDLVLAGEFPLGLEGDWFTTPPLREGDLLCIGYGRYEGRILALKETLEEPKHKAGG